MSWQVSWLSPKVRLPGFPVAFAWTFHKGMTVAGTAQDLHLIPFYAWEKLPGITKTAAKVHIIFLSAKLFERISIRTPAT